MKSKFLISLIFTILWNFANSQNYTFGVMSMSNMVAKSEGEISITDSLVTIFTNGKKLEYKKIKETNGIIYFTDDVMTHYFTMTSEKGKKKGFEYDTIIFFNPDKNFLQNIIIYWCKKKDE